MIMFADNMLNILGLRTICFSRRLVILILFISLFRGNCIAQDDPTKNFIVNNDGIITKYLHHSYLTVDIEIPEFIFNKLGEKVTIIGIQESVFKGSLLSRDNPNFKLKSIVLPPTLKIIGDHAFENNDLSSIDLPEGLTHIGDSAFENNNKLSSITLPEGLTHIGNDAFKVNKLTTIKLPSTLTSMGTGAFSSNEITEITSFGGITTIPAFAFENNKLESIAISNKIRYIREKAFGGNSSLEEVNFSEHSRILKIEAESFDSNPNLSIMLPTHASSKFKSYFDSNLQTYDSNDEIDAFDRDYFVDKGVYKLSNQDFITVNGVITGCSQEILSNHISIEIPDEYGGQSITGIAATVFNNKSLFSVILPSSIISIGNGAFEDNDLSSIALYEGLTYIGKDAFRNNELKTISLPSSLTNLGMGAFAQNGIVEISSFGGITSIQEETFNDNMLENITIPSTIHDIRHMSFTNNNLTEVAFSDNSNISVIEVESFDSNPQFSITLPTHNKAKFESYIDSEDVTRYPGDQISDFSLAYFANFEAYTLKDDDFTIVNGVITECSQEILSLYPSIKIPNNNGGISVTGIGEAVFNDKNLTSVVLPNSITSIGNGAFENNNLSSINLPEGLTYIGKDAFRNNELKTISLPSSLTNLGMGAFAQNGIGEISSFGAITEIKYETFYSNKLTNIEIPSSITSIGDSAFENNKLSSITLPEGLTYIGNDAFKANKLTKINLPSTLTSMGTGVFSSNEITEITSFGGITIIPTWTFNENKFETITFPSQITVISSQSFTDNPSLKTVLFVGISNLQLIEANSFPDNGQNKPYPISLPAEAADFEGSGDCSKGFYIDSKGDKYSKGNKMYHPYFSYSVIFQDIHTLKDDEFTITTDGVITACNSQFLEIKIPEITESGITIIGIKELVFKDKKLSSVVIPSTITSIGDSAFENNNLSSINLPEGLTYIGNDAFKANQLTTINLPSTLTSMGTGAFSSNEITEITSFGGITTIPAFAFEGNNLQSITIPSSITVVGTMSFTLNPSLTEVLFEEESNLAMIEANAFDFNYPPSITMPTHSSPYFISFIDSELNIYGLKENNQIFNYGRSYYSRLKYFLTKQDVTIDDGVIIGCNYDFSDVNNSRDISIPTKIDGHFITGIADKVFSSKGLYTVAFPTLLNNIGNSAFENNNLFSIDLNEELSIIGKYAFKNNFISALNLPTSINLIGLEAFSMNTPLTEVIFSQPSNILKIEADAFNNNPDLSSITLPKHVEMDFSYYLDSNGKEYNPIDESSNKITNFAIPYFVDSDDYTLEEDDLTVDEEGVIIACNRITLRLHGNIIVPHKWKQITITGVGNGVFQSTGLRSVKLPSTTTSIGTLAFANNYLTDETIDFHDGISAIGQSAFQGNRFTTLTLPASLTFLGKGVFQNNLIKEITSFGGITNIESMVFKGNQLEKITIPSNILIIGSSAFANNGLLEEVVFSNNSGILRIEARAFYTEEGAQLSKIILPTHVNPKINSYLDSEDVTHSAGEQITDFSIAYFANFEVYTLKDDDFTIVNGVITECSQEILSLYPSIKIPNNNGGISVTGIGKSVFKNQHLLSVELPPTITSIGDSAFYNNNLDLITLNEELSVIGKYAFWGNKLTKLSLPGSLNSLDTGAFAHNIIEEISFGGITIIEPRTFQNNLLTSIIIPNYIKYIGEFSFADNLSLKEVTFSPKSSLLVIEANAFTKTDLLLPISLPTHSEEDRFSHFISSKGVRYASADKFSDFSISYLTVIDESFYTLTDADFTVDGGVITGFKTKILKLNRNIQIPSKWNGQTITGVGSKVFMGAQLLSVKFSPQIEHIGDSAFLDNLISNNLVLPKDLISISNRAFYNNFIPGELKIPASVVEIGAEAFSSNGLKKNLFSKINFEDRSKIEKIGLKAFHNAVDMSKDPLPINLPTRTIYKHRFYWIDGSGSELEGSAEITNLETSYEAVTSEQFTLMLKDADHGSIIASPLPNEFLQTYDKDTKITLTVNPDEGYRFKKWMLESGSGEMQESDDYPLKITINSDTAVSVEFFGQIKLTVISPNGSISANSMPLIDDGYFDDGLDVYLVATPEEDYRFDKWKIVEKSGVSREENSKTLSLKISSELTVEAVYIKQVSLTLKSNIGTIEAFPKPNEGLNTYDIGTEVKLSADVPEGALFVKWKLFDGSTSRESIDWPLILDLDTDYEVIAFFKLQVSLTVVESNGSVSIEPQAENNIYDVNTAVTLTPKPNEGYKFSKWVIHDDLETARESKEVNLKITLSKNVKVTAVYLPPQVNLELLAENGRVTVNPELDEDRDTYDAGTQVTLTPYPDRGYKFDKWVIDGIEYSERTQSISLPDNTSLSDNTSVKVKAIFLKQKVTLSVPTPEYGTVIIFPDYEEYIYDFNTIVTLTPKAEDGYVFQKWVLSGETEAKDESFAPQLDVTLISDTTVTASFTLPQVSLGVTAENGRVEIVPKPQLGFTTYDIDTDVTIKALPSTGYRFEKWVVVIEDEGTKEYSDLTHELKLTANTSVEAQFMENDGKTRLKIKSVGLGAIIGADNDGIYDSDTTLVITASASQGHQFEKWVLTGPGFGAQQELSDIPLYLNMSQDTIVTGHFIPISEGKITLTLFTYGSGTIDGAKNGTEYDINSEVTLTAIPNSSNEFVKWVWSADGARGESIASTLNITLTSNSRVEAHFEETGEQATLTLFTEGLGTISGAKNNSKHPVDTNLSLTATPNAGYEFEKWEVSNLVEKKESEDTTLHVNLFFNTTVKAFFVEKEKATLSLSTVGLGSISGAEDGSVYYIDSLVTITAVPESGYEFEKWIILGNTETFTDIELSLNLVSDTTVEAHFIEINTILGIDNSIDTEIKVFPNPVNGEVTIRAEGIEIVRLRSLVGKVLYESIYSGLSDFKLNLMDFHAGTYFLEIIQKDGRITVKKVIKN